MAIITFLSDFGLRDSYVAEMKAAALEFAPRATVIDITHEIAPQDVVSASVTLGRVIDAFPRRTIHVAVVDPGVGTARRLLAVEVNRQIVLCPDNGLITWVWRMHRDAKAHMIRWEPKRRRGVTFDGRDRFAPVAGLLASSKKLSTLAERIDDPILLEFAPAPTGATRGKVIHIDHFGNATTNVPGEGVANGAIVSVGRRSLGRLRQTYADVEVGQPLALIGSGNLLEIAVRNGSAAKDFKLRVGDVVSIQRFNKGVKTRRDGEG